MRLRFYFAKRHSYVGFPNGLHIGCGYVSCPMNVKRRYSVSFSIKVNNKEYAIGFNIDKQFSKAELEKDLDDNGDGEH